MLVEEGQHVSKGQLLAEIEPTDYRNAFNAATAQKEAAQAVQQRADAGVRQQELEQARIDFERSEDEYKRMKFLVDRKSLPPNDFQKFEAAYKASRERYEMAKEGTRKEDIATAHAQAHAAEAQASEEGKRLSDTRLLAPISGQHQYAKSRPGPNGSRGNGGLLHRRSEPGQGPRGSSRSRNRKSAARRRPRRSLRLRSRDDASKGKSAIIGVAAEPASRTYTVKILVPNPGPVLLAGMVAEARIFGPAKVRALTIPAEAIVPRSARRAQRLCLLPGP